MKVDSAFFCDDVRQENNGKLLFIGAYMQDVVISRFPASLNLYVVLCLRVATPGVTEVEIEASYNGREIKNFMRSFV